MLSSGAPCGSVSSFFFGFKSRVTGGDTSFRLVMTRLSERLTGHEKAYSLIMNQISLMLQP